MTADQPMEPRDPQDTGAARYQGAPKQTDDDPTAGGWSSTWARFLSRCWVMEPTGCWLWTGPLDRNGYGFFWLDGATTTAHRASHLLHGGTVEDGQSVDHLCRRRSCVNPAHLEAVAHRTNIMRGDTIPARHAARTHCPQGHPYSGANLYVDPRGKRECHTCRRARRAHHV